MSKAASGATGERRTQARQQGNDSPAASPSRITASSIRRSITPRPCSIRSAEDYLAHRGPYHYGRRGTPTSEALENAVRELEGPACAGVALLPSGLAAISTALLSVLQAGDHVLVTDSVYGPTRNFCDSVLTRCGVETTYYDPLIGARHRGADPTQHPRGVHRSAGLADLRDAGHSGDRRGRAREDARGADGQYLGDAALFPRARARRRSRRSSPAPSISAAIPT